jgi:hypothetical protein
MTKHVGKRCDFWSKVDSSGGDDACWEWLGTRGSSGYGEVRVNKRLQKAHRRAWELTNGPIPEGKVVCHRCDNPGCCNPKHLFVGTHSDNMADMVAKGRQQRDGWKHWNPLRKWAKGEASGSAKLTEAQVREIRRRFEAGGISKVQLGREYNVTDVLIGKIVNKQVWTHVEDVAA